MREVFHLSAILLTFWTLLLVVAGGLVTSNDAGLSVPDWPLSYGKLVPNAVILQGVPGGLTVIYLLPPAISVSHACLAQIYFSTTVAIAVFIRLFAMVVPLCVLLQLALGAVMRHKALGTMWHICGSSLVTGVVLWFAVRILLHYADYPALRKIGSGVTWSYVCPGFSRYRSLYEPYRHG